MMNGQRNYSTMYLTYHVLQIPYKTTQQEKGKTIKVDNDLNESSEFMLNEKKHIPLNYMLYYSKYKHIYVCIYIYIYTHIFDMLKFQKSGTDQCFLRISDRMEQGRDGKDKREVHVVTKGQQTRCILVVTEQFCILTMVWDTKLTHALIHIELNTDTETYTHTHKV